ncbi:hypothetical protein D3C80_2060520 [compost metagenome]
MPDPTPTINAKIIANDLLNVTSPNGLSSIFLFGTNIIMAAAVASMPYTIFTPCSDKYEEPKLPIKLPTNMAPPI